MLRHNFHHQSQTVKRSAMNRLSIIAVTTASLILGVSLAVSSAVGQQNAQQTSDVEGVNAASQVFIAAIAARDIGVMDKVWAHEPYAARDLWKSTSKSPQPLPCFTGGMWAQE